MKGHNQAASTDIPSPSTTREAMLYESSSDGSVQCNLCAHRCRIREGKLGVCQVRKNVGGKLYTLVYGRTISEHVDPIEKKPLYHFHPGSMAYSIATPGCNFRCAWCQNWEISQMPRERHIIAGHPSDPQQIVNAALSTHCRSIAYTYTEPTVFFEYAYDTARIAHQSGLANLYITNGYMSGEMLDVFSPYLDAANVDLKSFRQRTYQRYIGAQLQPVLDSLITMKNKGIWVEITTLIIPEVNDDPAELREIAQFIVKQLDPDTPWHISRFYPGYQMLDVPPTPASTLLEAFEIGMEEGLHYVYIGNIHHETGRDTRCPICNRTLIRRLGFGVMENRIHDGSCPECGEPIAGAGMDG